MSSMMDEPVRRYELDRKLAAQDKRLSYVEQKVSRIAAGQECSCKTHHMETVKLREEVRLNIRDLRSDVERIRSDIASVRSDLDGLKMIIIVTGLAIVLGVALFNQSGCFNFLKPFKVALSAQGEATCRA